MVVVVVLGYLVVGAVEIYLCPERNLKKILAYIVVLAFAATLSVLVILNHDLPVPEPLNIIGAWLKQLWPGGD